MGNDETTADERRRKLMALSGEERVRMGFAMFQAEIDAFLSTLPPGLPEHERRVQKFIHFYGREFSDAERDRILAQIRGG